MTWGEWPEGARLPETSAVASLVGPVTTGTALALGNAPAFAMGMTYVAMADSISLAMENAVGSEQRGQVIGEAVLVKVLAKIIAQGAAKP